MAEAATEPGHLALGDNDIFDIDISTVDDTGQELELANSQIPVSQVDSTLNSAATTGADDGDEAVDEFDFQLGTDEADQPVDAEDVHTSNRASENQEQGSHQTAPQYSTEQEISYEDEENDHRVPPQEAAVEEAEARAVEDLAGRDEISYEDDNATDGTAPEIDDARHVSTNPGQPQTEDQQALGLSANSGDPTSGAELTVPSDSGLEALETTQVPEDNTSLQHVAPLGQESRESPLSVASNADIEERDLLELPDLPPLSDVKVVYDDVEYELCARDGNDNPDTYFFAGDEELDLPLSGFLSSLRRIISNEIGPDDELVVRIDQLRLEIGENASESFLEYTTFREVIDLFHHFQRNDGVELTQPVIHLVTRPDSEQRFANLLDAANYGCGLQNLPSTRAPVESSNENSPLADASQGVADGLNDMYELLFNGEPGADANGSGFPGDRGSPEATMTDAGLEDEGLASVADDGPHQPGQPWDPEHGENGPTDDDDDVEKDEIDYQDYEDEEQKQQNEDRTAALQDTTGSTGQSVTDGGHGGSNNELETRAFSGTTGRRPSTFADDLPSTKSQHPPYTSQGMDPDLIDYSDDDEPGSNAPRQYHITHTPAPSFYYHNPVPAQEVHDTIDFIGDEELDSNTSGDESPALFPAPVRHIGHRGLAVPNKANLVSPYLHANFSSSEDFEEDLDKDGNPELLNENSHTETYQPASRQEYERDDSTSHPDDKPNLAGHAEPADSSVPLDPSPALQSSPSSTVRGDETDLGDDVLDMGTDFGGDVDIGAGTNTADFNANGDAAALTTAGASADHQESIDNNSNSGPQEADGPSTQEIDEIDWEDDGDDGKIDSFEELDVYQVTPPGGSAKRSRQPDDQGDLADESDVKRRRT